MSGMSCLLIQLKLLKLYATKLSNNYKLNVTFQMVILGCSRHRRCSNSNVHRQTSFSCSNKSQDSHSGYCFPVGWVSEKVQSIKYTMALEMNIWKIINLNRGERYEDLIDHCSYTHNVHVSSCKISLILAMNGIRSWVRNLLKLLKLFV